MSQVNDPTRPTGSHFPVPLLRSFVPLLRSLTGIRPSGFITLGRFGFHADCPVYYEVTSSLSVAVINGLPIIPRTNIHLRKSPLSSHRTMQLQKKNLCIDVTTDIKIQNIAHRVFLFNTALGLYRNVRTFIKVIFSTDDKNFDDFIHRVSIE